MYVCAKHFQKEDIQYFHTVPRGDGTSYEVPRGRPKLNPGAVPSLLPGCPSYYSSTPSTGHKRTRFSYDSKEEDLLNQATNLNLRSEYAEMEKFRVGCIGVEVARAGSRTTRAARVDFGSNYHLTIL